MNTHLTHTSCDIIIIHSFNSNLSSPFSVYFMSLFEKLIYIIDQVIVFICAYTDSLIIYVWEKLFYQNSIQ
jgi:hypothetical protein